MKNKCASSLIHSHSTSWLASWSCDLRPHIGPHALKGPALGWMLLVLKSEQEALHCQFALGPANYIPGPGGLSQLRK